MRCKIGRGIKQTIAYAMMALLTTMAGMMAPAAELKIPKTGWSVNNFKDPTSGAQIDFTNAPDGTDAIKLRFFGPGPANVGCTNIADQAKTWPDTFGRLGCYVRGDGSYATLNIQFREADGYGYTAGIRSRQIMP